MEKYIVKLTGEERKKLKDIINKGRAARAKVLNGRILLKVDEGRGGQKWSDEDTSKALDVSTRTIERLRKRFVTEGYEASLNRKPPSRTKTIKIDGEVEAHIIALACSKPPEGYAKWTLKLLANHMVQLEYIDNISTEGVRRTLKKTNLNRG